MFTSYSQRPSSHQNPAKIHFFQLCSGTRNLSLHENFLSRALDPTRSNCLFARYPGANSNGILSTSPGANSILTLGKNARCIRCHDKFQCVVFGGQTLDLSNSHCLNLNAASADFTSSNLKGLTTLRPCSCVPLSLDVARLSYQPIAFCKQESFVHRLALTAIRNAAIHNASKPLIGTRSDHSFAYTFGFALTTISTCDFILLLFFEFRAIFDPGGRCAPGSEFFVVLCMYSRKFTGSLGHPLTV